MPSDQLEYIANDEPERALPELPGAKQADSSTKRNFSNRYGDLLFGDDYPRNRKE